MNMLWSWMEINMLSLAALEVLIKVTLVLGVVAIISFFTNLTVASKRLMWSAAIVIALLIPFNTILLPAIEVPLLAQQPAPVQTQQSSANPSEVSRPIAELTLRNERQIATVDNGTQSPVAVTQSPRPTSWFTGKTVLVAATILWLLGLAFFARKLWRQHRHVQTIKENARDFSNHNTFAVGEGKSNVCVLISDDIATPVAVGALNPVIILPTDAQYWDAEKLRSAIGHEMAHVRGRDNLVRACASLLCVVYWFHPLVWYSARKLYEEQEKTADNAVLNQGISASVYAQNLLDIVKSLQGNNSRRYENTLSATMASYSFFPQRMRSILSDNQNRQGMGAAKALASIVAITALALPATLLTTQASRAQSNDNNADEPVRIIDFAQNTVTEDQLAAQQTSPSSAPPREEQIFHELDAQMTEAFNRRDLDKLVALYTDDAEIRVDGDFGADTYRGKREIQQYWNDLLDTDMTIRTQVQSIARDGDKATVDVRYWSSFSTDFGELNDFFGGETTTNWQLIDGEWRIVGDYVHEPDYVNDESLNHIVDTAMKPLEEMDWEGFGESLGAAMEVWGEEMGKSFENLDFGNSWGWGDKSRNNPLINAVESGNSKTVRILLENGADPDPSTSWGRSALYLAVEMGEDDMVKHLLNFDADVNSASAYGKTPLFVAAENGNLAIVKRLVDHGADLNQATRSGRTPLSVAAKAGHDEVVEYLVEHGANIGV